MALGKKESDEIIDMIFGSHSGSLGGLAATVASRCLSANLRVFFGHIILQLYEIVGVDYYLAFILTSHSSFLATYNI